MRLAGLSRYETCAGLSDVMPSTILVRDFLFPLPLHGPLDPVGLLDGLEEIPEDPVFTGLSGNASSPIRSYGY